MLQQLAAGAVGKEEAVLLAALLLTLANVGFQVLHLDDHVMLVGELADAGHQLGGIDQIDGKHAKEKADDK